MDIEKTMQFILDQQAHSGARHAAWKAEFDAGMEELKKRQDATERLINAFARAGQAQIELHTAQAGRVGETSRDSGTPIPDVPRSVRRFSAR
jgi:hypothetical protein